MELEAAWEILAEVFRFRRSEVDEMIRGHFEAEEMGIKGNGLWPQEFWLKGEAISSLSYFLHQS
jgi:hypothetical protein